MMYDICIHTSYSHNAFGTMLTWDTTCCHDPPPQLRHLQGTLQLQEFAFADPGQTKRVGAKPSCGDGP